MAMAAEDDSAVRMKPLFVLSLWRSGSSLLHALLNQHSQIALLYEGELPQLQLLLHAHFRSGTWREKWEFWNQGPSRHGIVLDSMPANVADAWEATRLVYREHAQRKSAIIWGEKSPHWYDNALRMAEKFPDAQFVFLWRDVHDVIESIERAARSERFFRKPGFATRVLVGSERLRQACEALRAKGRAVHEVDYKDLTSNTAECMRQISRFLEITFEPQMTSLVGADRSATFSGQHHELLRSDHVVSGAKRPRSISPSLRAKIDRYACRWELQQGHDWSHSMLVRQTQPPGRRELLLDRFFYRALISWDKLVQRTYSAVPRAFAHSLRAWSREHAYATSNSPVKSEPV